MTKPAQSGHRADAAADLALTLYERSGAAAYGVSAERFESLLAQQLPDVEKRRRADFVVDSSTDFDSTRAQVRAILQQAKQLPRRRA